MTTTFLDGRKISTISSTPAGKTRGKWGEAETNRDREIEREYNGEEWLGDMDAEAEIAREEGAGVGNRSSRDERSRTRGERSGEQGDGVSPE